MWPSILAVALGLHFSLQISAVSLLLERFPDIIWVPFIRAWPNLGPWLSKRGRIVYGYAPPLDEPRSRVWTMLTKQQTSSRARVAIMTDYLSRITPQVAGEMTKSSEFESLCHCDVNFNLQNVLQIRLKNKPSRANALILSDETICKSFHKLKRGGGPA